MAVENLLLSIEKLKGIGPKKSALLKKSGIYNLFDLALYKPEKLIFYEKIDSIYQKPGEMVIVKLDNIVRKIYKPKYILFVGILRLEQDIPVNIILFNPKLIHSVKNIVRGKCTYKFYKNQIKEISFIHPEFISEFNNKKIQYNLPTGVSAKDITKHVNAIDKVEEWLPKNMIRSMNLLPWNEAIIGLHNELSENSIKRLAFDEIMFLYGHVLKLDKKLVNPCHPDFKLRQSILSKLNITLINSQIKSLKEIDSDIASDKQMCRLLHGDVGSGKTLVAILSLTSFLKSGKQVAFLAPTGILAQQHYKNLRYMLPENVHITLITSDTNKKIKSDLNEFNIIVGTHAIIEDDIIFRDLEYIIIDEQHKFGVKQRQKLEDKGKANILIMSATPIPRTMEKAMNGIVDISKLTESPFEKQIHTHLISSQNIESMINKVHEIIQNGIQGYWICPSIEENEYMESLESRIKTMSKFKKNITMLHGKMKNKEEIISEFKNKKTHLLLSTTAIETGIDISSARFIVIEHAERFGLAQLHQIRGRIGRNNEVCHCFLVYNCNKNSHSYKRLEIIQNSLNGFEIAEKDLEMRGAGQIYGNSQSGYFKAFDFFDPVEHSYFIKYIKSNLHNLGDRFDKLILLMQNKKNNTA